MEGLNLSGKIQFKCKYTKKKILVVGPPFTVAFARNSSYLHIPISFGSGYGVEVTVKSANGNSGGEYLHPKSTQETILQTNFHSVGILLVLVMGYDYDADGVLGHAWQWLYA